jgi:hypothetical protein
MPKKALMVVRRLCLGLSRAQAMTDGTIGADQLEPWGFGVRHISRNDIRRPSARLFFRCSGLPHHGTNRHALVLSDRKVPLAITVAVTWRKEEIVP